MRHIIIGLLCIFIFSSCTTTTVEQEKLKPVNISVNGYPTRYKEAMGQYSFGLAVCEELPSAWIADIIKKPILSTEDFNTQDNTGCKYITDTSSKDGIMVVVNYLEAENQKKGQQILGRIITTDPNIKMDHFIAKQEDGNINAIYLVLAPKKFVRVDRTSVKVADNDTMLILATRIAEVIKPQ